MRSSSLVLTTAAALLVVSVSPGSAEDASGTPANNNHAPEIAGQSWRRWEYMDTT